MAGDPDAARPAPAQGGVAATRSPRRGLSVVGLSFVLLGALVAPDARAGQVRVDVGAGGQFFMTYAVNVNIGDQVCWVWKAGGHTVTNWNFPADSLGFSFDGTIFDSDAGGLHFGQASTTRFSWKSDRLGHVPYVCVPHENNMSGRIIVSDPQVSAKVPVADFRISEVQFNAPSGLDLIEITNYGLATGNLGSYRIATTTSGPTQLLGPSGSSADIIVTSGAKVVLHLNAAGTTTNSDLFFSFVPGAGLPNTTGSLALYLPYTPLPGNDLTNADMIIDFVQWGFGGQANEATAVAAGFWAAGNSINNVAAGHSIEYCADADLNHGVGRWAEIFPPNIGTNNVDCLTPTLNETWGRIKILYRK